MVNSIRSLTSRDAVSRRASSAHLRVFVHRFHRSSGDLFLDRYRPFLASMYVVPLGLSLGQTDLRQHDRYLCASIGGAAARGPRRILLLPVDP